MTEHFINTVFIAEQLDALLPQTQCGQCGHPCCRPYAEAMAQGEAINRCVPGGQRTINQIAAFLKVEPLPLDSHYGIESDVKKIAYIREVDCIGCTKCLQACPVDAIIGAAKHTFTVISDECTGCNLCVAPCPVDCIDMLPIAPIQHTTEADGQSFNKAKADHARTRFNQRNARLAHEASQAEARRLARITPTPQVIATPTVVANTTQSIHNDKALIIAAALARTNLKKAQKRLQAAQTAGHDTSKLMTEINQLQQEVEQMTVALSNSPNSSTP